MSQTHLDLESRVQAAAPTVEHFIQQESPALPNVVSVHFTPQDGLAMRFVDAPWPGEWDNVDIYG